MRRLTVPLPDREYPILIGDGLLAQVGERLRDIGRWKCAALVQDEAVAGLYGPTLRGSLEAAGFRVLGITVPSGEGSKSLEGLSRVYDALAAGRLDRQSVLVTLGGGVVGDLGGFAAATYLRGIDFVQVPTTLLAQVDASVGGKTGIDLPCGKNLVGAFHQPQAVLVDLETLRTLPESEYRAGLAEVIKYGVIADPELFRFLRERREAVLARDSAALAHLVARSCEIKADVVGRDERESGLRAILNYGHTVGHAIEVVAGYGAYLHGEAVAIGMAAAGRLAEQWGWLASGVAGEITELTADYGLPVRLREPLPAERLLAAMRLDKKVSGGELRFILARGMGHVELTAVGEREVLPVLGWIQPADRREG